jgi:quercetin dioxygenase-like cupin family protein
MTHDMVQAQTLKPFTVTKAAGEARWWFSNLAVIKATAADTGGQMTIIEITEPPGVAGPLHVHHREDESFWILEGDVEIEVGGETIHAQAGDFVFGPRDIPHRYTVGGAGCRMLFILTPGGFEDLVIEMSRPAAQRTVPPPSTEALDWARVAAIAKAHGNELLQP